MYRCTSPSQHGSVVDLRATDGVLKLETDEVALELFAWITVALVAVVSCARKTHIRFIFVSFLDALHEYEDITTPSLVPGGESGCSPQKALPGPGSSSPSTSP